MENLYKLSYELHDELINCNEYIDLKNKEKIMEEDELLIPLFLAYKNAQEKYVNNKTEANLKTIRDLKLEIETNNKVIEYNKAYKKYLQIVDDITSIAFKDLITNDNIFNELGIKKNENCSR